MGIIYMAKNKLDGKVYIGQTTKKLKERRSNHISLMKTVSINRNELHGFLLALYEDGIDSFEWSILEECSNSSLKDRENYYIKYYRLYHPEWGYNRTNKYILLYKDFGYL